MQKEKIIWLLIICVTILASCFLISQTKFVVNTNGSTSWDHTITVDGNWEVRVTPDVLIINLNVTETAKTTKEAQKLVNEKIEAIKDVIKSFDIKDSDVQSTNMNVYEDYDRTDTGRKSLWFTANHNLQIKIKWINAENEGIWWKLIQKISEVGNVLVNNISYDIDDKTEYYSEARKLAIEKARQKAEDLAKYADVKLWKPISISESRNYDYAYTTMAKNSFYTEEAVADSDIEWGFDISLWEMKITLDVTVVYEIK